MLFVVLCPGTPEGSTGSGSGFKASQKTGQRLKVSSDSYATVSAHEIKLRCHYYISIFIIINGVQKMIVSFEAPFCKQLNL